MGFQVDQIDHVELFVPDRHQAAAWYRDVLGLEIITDLAEWADDPQGPLMIATRQGDTKLALFQGSPVGSQRHVGFYLLAFRVGATAFLEFITRLAELELRDAQGRRVAAEHVRDHGRAYSIYFCDPYAHCLELTTYDYAAVRSTLSR